jgi:predicted RecA/RadA family phage recombinase
MARNEVFRDADHLSLPVPAGTKAGAPVAVGSFVGVVEVDEGTGSNAAGYASVWRKGAHRFPVTGAVASVGLPIYITGANALTTTASGNTLFGYSLGTKGAGTGDLVVVLARV